MSTGPGGGALFPTPLLVFLAQTLRPMERKCAISPILRQQKRIAHLRFQQAYRQRLQQQRTALVSARYDYYEDPFFYTGPSYRYRRDGRYYMTNEIGMEALARAQPGFLSFKSYASDDGEVIALSEWADEAAARAWGRNAEHAMVQGRGREGYYQDYTLFACAEPRVHRFEDGNCRLNSTASPTASNLYRR